MTVLLLSAIIFAGCSKQVKGKTVYRTVNENLDKEEVIKIISDTELEVTMPFGFSGSETLGGQYTIEEDKIRIKISALGTEIIEYFDVIDEGLKGESGKVYYNPKAYQREKEALLERQNAERSDEAMTKLREVEEDLEKFALENNRVPEHFAELKSNSSFRWSAGDPWGNDYVYKVDHSQSPATYELFSLGADGIENTDDDVYAYPLDQRMQRASQLNDKLLALMAEVRRTNELVVAQRSTIRESVENGITVVRFLAYPEVWSQTIEFNLKRGRYRYDTVGPNPDTDRVRIRFSNGREYGPNRPVKSGINSKTIAFKAVGSDPVQVTVVYGEDSDAVHAYNFMDSPKDICRSHLENIGAGLQKYTNANDGIFPPLQFEENIPFFELGSVYPRYITDFKNFRCPSISSSATTLLGEAQKYKADDSAKDYRVGGYWYMGYAIPSDASAKQLMMLLFSTKETRTFTDNLEFPKVVDLSRWPLKTMFRLRHGVETEIENEAKANTKALSRGESLLDRKLTSSEKMKLMTPRRRGYHSISPSDIPVVIENPTNHGDGGHVLFMDGSVRFMEYPGEFPMSEFLIDGLQKVEKQN